MTNETNPVEQDINDFIEPDLMKIFDELSFKEKWAQVREWLKEPKDSGKYKWAKLQMLRLLSPVLSVVVPLVAIGLMVLLSNIKPEQNQSIVVNVIEPTPIEELEEIIEEPVQEIIETPIITEIQTDVMAECPSLPTDTISPPAEVASVQPAPFDSVAIIKSPVMMKSIMGSRNPGAQGAAIGKYGGSDKTQLAVLRALRWLAKNQNTDGTWGKDKPAMTALAVLAYLAHGDTPSSEEFGSVVERALRYLIEAQEPSGRFKGRDGHDYTHPIVTYAISEAYGMTKNPTLKEVAINALKVIVKGQNQSGGFNYGLVPSERDDTSYMAWCVQALKAGKIAELDYEIEGYGKCMTNSIRGFKKNYGEKDGYGGFGYVGPSSNHGLSGAGVLCLQFLGQGKSKEVRNALPMLQKNFAFNWETPPSGSVVYYWYYITQACFQEGGAIWDDWNKQFSPALVKVQKVIDKTQSGYVDNTGQPQDIGSWISPAASEHNGGNGEMMDTTLCALQLMVFYRYLPSTQRVVDDEIKQELKDNDIKIEIN